MSTPAKTEPFWLDKYRPEFLDELKDMESATVAQLARHFNVCRDTIYSWGQRYPEFGAEVRRCRAGLIQDMETALVQQAKGEIQGNATAAIFLLKNLAPDDYRDRREVQVETTGTVVLDYTGFELEDESGEDFIEGDFEEIFD